MDQFKNQFINGQWKKGSSEKELEDFNPFTAEILLNISSANEEDLDEAYEAAKNAQKKWALTTPAEKQMLFVKLVQVMQEQKEEIIDWLIKESGSTRLKAELEFQSSISIITESSSFPHRMGGTIIQSNYPNKENRVYRMPKGVIGVIGPWNFPLHLTMRSVAPALATGNSVVIKPASDTPVTSGLLVGKLFHNAGFPDGLVNVVVGKGSEIGDAFVEHPTPKLISFTGSTEVGKGIGEKAGKTLKEVALELGGNNAMIVLKDANVKEAAKAAVFGKFFHQGQICMALNRIIVVQEVYDEFVQSFIDYTSKLKTGNPNQNDTFIGPLINKNAIERI
ncbi:aldehyde dehydrogenase family protein [Heyndrickxia acidicola]|uniref:aldehyde dehydrogenase family protein n=1 Tax=Heyndrickxia acidicola TaxID=209389 RepID=UPI000B24D139